MFPEETDGTCIFASSGEAGVVQLNKDNGKSNSRKTNKSLCFIGKSYQIVIVKTTITLLFVSVF